MPIGDLNDLRLLVAVVAHGGFSAAGRAMGVPKSRISRRIRALEDELGVRLLERSTRRFAVTEIGQDVYRHARAALAEADTIEAAASRLKAEPQGVVRISCPVGADRLLAVALPGFLERFPRLRIQMIVTNRRINLIEEGVDVAVRVRERLDTDVGLQLKIIGRTQSRLMASPGLLARLGTPESLEDLQRFPTLGFTEIPGTDRWILVGANGQEQEFVHEPRLAATDFAILRQATMDGVGVGYLPELQFRGALSQGQLVHILPQWGSHEATMHLVFTSRRGLLPSVRAVIDFLVDVLDVRSAAWSAP
ncbi:MAG: LysR family transcriptional regulator [Alphaproteobacteria bacterium]|nr:LysR family transcriptional regulator [Alphaproteobacteria bacterium]